MERYIFLDTNIYINAGYSFGRMHMKKFSELVSNDGLVLLACSTCIGEVEKHIKTDLESAVKELNKALKRREFAALRNDNLYKDKLIEICNQSQKLLSCSSYIDKIGNHIILNIIQNAIKTGVVIKR